MRKKYFSIITIIFLLISCGYEENKENDSFESYICTRGKNEDMRFSEIKIKTNDMQIISFDETRKGSFGEATEEGKEKLISYFKEKSEKYDGDDGIMITYETYMDKGIYYVYTSISFELDNLDEIEKSELINIYFGIDLSKRNIDYTINKLENSNYECSKE